MAIQHRVARVNASGAASPITISSTGVVAGDTVILAVRLSDNITPTFPAGFTAISGAQQVATTGLHVWGKVATGAEPADYSITFAAGTGRAGLQAIYSDTGAALVVDAAASQSNGASGTYTFPSVTTTVANTFLTCFIASTSSVTMTAGGSFTKRFDASGANALNCMTKAQAAIGATGTHTATGSSTASKTATVAWAEVAADPPDAPSDLVAVAVSGSRIDLSWVDNADDEDGVSIEQSPNGTTGWVEIATVAAGVEAYSVTGLAQNTEYWFKVRAFKDD